MNLPLNTDGIGKTSDKLHRSTPFHWDHLSNLPQG